MTNTIIENSVCRNCESLTIDCDTSGLYEMVEQCGCFRLATNPRTLEQITAFEKELEEQEVKP